MDANLVDKLRNWRGRRAMLDSTEVFRVLSNETLNEIARVAPKTKEAILEIKGFKDKKFAKYGQEILNIISGSSTGEAVEGMGNLFGGTSFSDNLKESARERINKSKMFASIEAEDSAQAFVPMEKKEESGEKIFSVSDYLDLINIALGDFQSKVIGEVSSIEAKGSAVYFNLKDKNDGSALNCFMWQADYRLCGIRVEQGMEVVVFGSPNIYKPIGRMSMRVSTIELVGEGALKKAYDELKLKLDKEGVFAPEKKRAIVEYPERIGLITSKTGAVIHDFLNNIGKFGYQIRFVDSRVEGQLAVKDLISAVKFFRNKDIDVLVMIRGGGSLESLQAFNNEALVREIADFPVPVICGIGHDKDVPLASLAADMHVSTPTAVTKVLNSSWERALAKVEIYKRDIVNVFGSTLVARTRLLDQAGRIMQDSFAGIFEQFREAEASLKLNFGKLGYYIKSVEDTIRNRLVVMTGGFIKSMSAVRDNIKNVDKLIEINNPERQLRLGYGLVRANGIIIKSIDGVEVGQEVDIKLADGSIKSKVINKNHGREN